VFEKKSEGFFVLNPKGMEKLIEEENKKLESELIKQDLGNMLFESGMDKIKISELEVSQGDLLMEIAILKMGGSI